MRTFTASAETHVVHKIEAEGSPYYEGGIHRRDVYDLLHQAEAEYKRVTGSEATNDDDWWLVPTDDGVAVRFRLGGAS